MDIPLAPSEMRIICPACMHRNEVTALEVEPEAAEIRCRTCNKRFGLMTRFVTEAVGGYDALGEYKFEVTTAEEGGRLRPRTIKTINTNARIIPRTWITVVTRAGRELGVADQTNATWWDVPWRRPAPPRQPLLWKAVFAAVVLIVLVYGREWFQQTLVAIDAQPGVMLGLLVISVASLMPMAWWVLRAYTDDGE